MFGLWGECPKDAPVAWGARGIMERDGAVSLLWDRQSIRGEDHPDWQAFVKHLNGGPLKEAVKVASMFGPHEDEVRTLYQDDKVTIKGNPRSSYGYVYLIAYPTEVEEQ